MRITRLHAPLITLRSDITYHTPSSHSIKGSSLSSDPHLNFYPPTLIPSHTMPRPKRTKVTRTRPAEAPPPPAATSTSDPAPLDQPTTSDDSDGLLVSVASWKRKPRPGVFMPMMSGGLGKGDVRAAPSTPRTKSSRVELSRIAREADHAKALQGLKQRRQEEADRKRRDEEAAKERSEEDVAIGHDQNASERHDETAEDVRDLPEEEDVGGLATSTEAGPVMESSMMAIANFKRRARQPSILRMVRGRQDKDGLVDQDEDEDDLDFSLGPDDFSPDNKTSLFQQGSRRTSRKRRSSALEVDETDDERDLGKSHAEKSIEELQFGRSAGSTSAVEGPRQVSPGPLQSSREQSPALPTAEAHDEDVDAANNTSALTHAREPEREATPAVLSDTMAPPASSSSDDNSGHQNGHGSGPTRADPSTGDAAHPKTGITKAPATRSKAGGKGKSKPLSTAELRDLLPRRRRQAQRQAKSNVQKWDAFDIYGTGESTPEAEQPADALHGDDDGSVHQSKRPRRAVAARDEAREPLSPAGVNRHRKASARTTTMTKKKMSHPNKNGRAVSSNARDAKPRERANGVGGVTGPLEQENGHRETAEQSHTLNTPTKNHGTDMSPPQSSLASSNKENHFGARHVDVGKDAQKKNNNDMGRSVANPSRGTKRVLQPARITLDEDGISMIDDDDSDDYESDPTPTKKRRVARPAAASRVASTAAGGKPTEQADELSVMAQKFREVDEWELCFEEVTPPSPSPPTRSRTIRGAVAVVEDEESTTPQQPPSSDPSANQPSSSAGDEHVNDPLPSPSTEAQRTPRRGKSQIEIHDNGTEEEQQEEEEKEHDEDAENDSDVEQMRKGRKHGKAAPAKKKKKEKTKTQAGRVTKSRARTSTGSAKNMDKGSAKKADEASSVKITDKGVAKAKAGRGRARTAASAGSRARGTGTTMAGRTTRGRGAVGARGNARAKR